jgi:predicted TIM-barrel enzyme
MPRFSREEMRSRFQQMIKSRQPIIGGGAGTGLSAKCEEAGGIDLIVIYNSGRYRMAGRGSLSGLLAYGNANAVVMEMATEILPVVKKTPVLAGVNGTDPFCLFEVFLDELAAVGFSGVQNFPTVGLIDGVFRQNLEETGISYALEVEMIRKAHEKNLFTTPYVFDCQQAEAMARAGADIIVAHMGLTTGGTIGAKTALSLEQCVQRVDAIAEAALDVRNDIIILCHGGPISEPGDAARVLHNARHCHGFFPKRKSSSESSFERHEEPYAKHGLHQSCDRRTHRESVGRHARFQWHAGLSPGDPGEHHRERLPQRSGWMRA